MLISAEDSQASLFNTFLDRFISFSAAVCVDKHKIAFHGQCLCLDTVSRKGFANHFVLLLQFHESRNAAEREKGDRGGSGQER